MEKTPLKRYSQAIWLYNYERPHLALAYQKPHQVYINAMKISLN